MVILRLRSDPPGTQLAPLLEVVAVRTGDGLWVDLRGEADLASRDTLEEALSHLESHPADQVHLELARLEFCDLGCARALARFAERVRRRGGTVSVHDVRPVFRRAVNLLRAEDALGL